VDSPTPPAKSEQIARYEATSAELQSVIAGLLAQSAALVARVSELERQIGLNSSNSGNRPPAMG
jgi:hypothetical protein